MCVRASTRACACAQNNNSPVLYLIGTGLGDTV
nr:MAG TPA: Tetrapyrrole methylase family protein methylase, Chlorobium tepidum, Structural [Microviridae sp.]